MTLPRHLTALLFTALLASLPASAYAQTSTEQKPADQQKGAAPAEPGRSDAASRRVDEIAEAGRLLSGPAANPECVWLGRRVVNLLWRDDLDTAFRHLDLYDRFGCPGAHVQSAFRCVISQGNIDPKSPESLNARVHACWLNPSLPSSAATPAPASQNASGSPPGTNVK